ncbi:MAG: ATP phosphoribosyltransferase [Gemmatimonadales bacterium]|nr:ATP phosphoribosyltransferase [bacterium HR33]GIW51218.1 MAG: ATP phosphoribosyltransferase [Gemmatimonadales bacterium]
MELLADAGIEVVATARSYRPLVSLPAADAKVLKPQNIVEMLAVGRRDVGFTGADWVAELGAPLVEVLDTGLDPVKVVAAAPASLLEGGRLPSRRLLVASEYENLAMSWIVRRGLDAECVRSYGATEVFPPEDADVIVDNRATGATLDANHLVVIDTLMDSSTRLYASPHAWEDPPRRERIEALGLLLGSVLEARSRVMVEANARREVLDAVVRVLPAMREPTVAPLYGDGGFAVRAAVPRVRLPEIVVALRAAGATDIVVTGISQIVP